MIVSSRVTSKLISELDSGKSSGPDNISSESLKFASNRLSVLLSLCFSVCLSHGYLPPAMIKTTIVPIVKNKCGNISESNTYRPIALATIISKLFESVLLVKCEDYLSTCSNQFGFKKGHSTDLCIYPLKEYIEYYKNRKTSVFVSMLDASKAFDRVNFCLLFQKLLSRNVPLFIVRILAMWYTHQKMCIRWGNAISPSFTVSNGVKQGGIISPILFNVYMDGLNVLLNSSNVAIPMDREFTSPSRYAISMVARASSSLGVTCLGDPLVKLESPTSLSNTN